MLYTFLLRQASSLSFLAQLACPWVTVSYMLEYMSVWVMWQKGLLSLVRGDRGEEGTMPSL